MTDAALDWRDRVLRARSPGRYLVPRDRIRHVVVALMVLFALAAFVAWDNYFDPCSVYRNGTYYRAGNNATPIHTWRGVCIPGL